MSDVNATASSLMQCNSIYSNISLALVSLYYSTRQVSQLTASWLVQFKVVSVSRAGGRHSYTDTNRIAIPNPGIPANPEIAGLSTRNPGIEKFQ